MTAIDPAPASVAERLPPDGPAIVRFAVPISTSASPLSAYIALAGGDDRSHAFLLESADKTDASDPDGAFRPSNASTERHARYSFVGVDPIGVMTDDGDGMTLEALRDDPLLDVISPKGDSLVERLRSGLPDVPRVGFENGNRQRLEGGLVGYLGYESVYDLWLNELGHTRPETQVPDAEFVVTNRTLVFDEIAGTCELVCTPVVRDRSNLDAVVDRVRDLADTVQTAVRDPSTPELGGVTIEAESADPQAAYEAAVERAKEHVLDGDVYQVVLSRQRELIGSVDARGLYAALRSVNPSPYMYLLEFGDRTIVGASPETLVSVKGDHITSNPIAGTCPRGESPVDDRRLAGEMLADEKELAEHTMLVDLARNDVRRVAEPGSVRVEEFMSVLKYSHVQHIESTVTGTLAADADAVATTRASFPAGTLSGAPKLRAMEIIEDLETSARGIYGGGVGYFSWTGDVDMAIVIRSATIEHGERDRITVRAGAGIVADSDPTSEYEETEAKMDGVMTAIDRLRDSPSKPATEVRSHE